MECKIITNIYADFEGLRDGGKLPQFEDPSSLQIFPLTFLRFKRYFESLTLTLEIRLSKGLVICHNTETLMID